jgi:hypothetical protein
MNGSAAQAREPDPGRGGGEVDVWRDFVGMLPQHGFDRLCNRSAGLLGPFRNADGKTVLMTSQPYSQLVRYKQWADRGLCDVVARNLERLDAEDTASSCVSSTTSMSSTKFVGIICWDCRTGSTRRAPRKCRTSARSRAA